MKQVLTFKMPFNTRHFNQGQRVWIVYLTGAQAALCYGRFRRRKRWVYAWVNWSKSHRTAPNIEEFEVANDFAERIHRGHQCNERHKKHAS